MFPLAKKERKQNTVIKYTQVSNNILENFFFFKMFTPFIMVLRDTEQNMHWSEIFVAIVRPCDDVDGTH